ncbi:hypothetical protein, partial [Sporisorium scitamineum]
KQNGSASNGTAISTRPRWISPLLSRYILIAALQSTASQLGFLSLRYISYPTLTLAKSCKLVPVLVMNVVLYRRKFAAYKYAVVGLVTLGIWLFMAFAPAKPGKKAKGPESSSLIGLLLCLLNLVLDGATNSTQDQVFSKFGRKTVSAGQMMLVMNAISALLMALALSVPLPLLSTPGQPTQLSTALAFTQKHPQVWRDIIAYALAGAVGQVSIFETLERFGSLTLVSITVTRKLFTMLLSVVVYNHELSRLQWVGVAVVFAGIGIEAREKRREGLAKKVRHSVHNNAKSPIATRATDVDSAKRSPEIGNIIINVQVLQSFGTPFAQFIYTISRIARIITFSALGVATIGVVSFEAAHQYVEHVAMPAASASSEATSDEYGWNELALEESWSGSPDKTGTDPRLGIKGRHAVRSAWMCANWGGGISPSVMFGGSAAGNSGLGRTAITSMGSAKTLKVDDGMILAMQYLNLAVKIAAAKGIKLPDTNAIRAGLVGEEAARQQLSNVDVLALALEARLAAVKERQGSRGALESAITSYEKLRQDAEEWLNRAVSIAATAGAGGGIRGAIQ